MTSRSLAPLWAAALFTLAPARGDESRGQADIAAQGYYLGATSERLNDTSGLALRMDDFLPNVGLLRLSFENYGEQGRFQTGENYLQLNGFAWGGRKWNFSAGDFTLPTAMTAIPFSNIIYPDMFLRGFRIQANHKQSTWSVFFGQQNLMEGPRIPFRMAVPQTALGVSYQRKWGERLQIAARWIRFSSSPADLEQNAAIFPETRQFPTADTASVQVTERLAANLKAFAEISGSRSEAIGDTIGHPFAPSVFAGLAWESKKVTARANYVSQGVDYMPLPGYYIGDRRGPFAEVHYRPWERLELSGAASEYTNNLEKNPAAGNYRSYSDTFGATLILPYKFNLSVQDSRVRFSADSGAGTQVQVSNNEQRSLSLAKQLGKHTLRFSLREFNLQSTLAPQKQLSREIEDSMSFKRLVLGVAARLDSYLAQQHHDTFYGRAFGQFRFKRVSAYGNWESGNDLVNESVFSTNTVRTTLLGASAALSHSWSAQFEGFRNTLNTQINPENIFVLQSQGALVSTALAGLDRWSFYFRVVKHIQWGAPLPQTADALGDYLSAHMPLVGAIEGVVLESSLAGVKPAAGVPVSIDNGRSTKTDDAGRFRFQQVPEGVHSVAIVVSELPTDFDPGSTAKQAVEIEPRHTAAARLEVVRLTQLSGKVSVAAGVSPENILIRLLPTDRYTTPDADGVFLFSNVREGDYEIAVDRRTLPEGTVLKSPERVSVPVRIGVPVPAIEFQTVKEEVARPVRKIVLKPE